MVDWASNINYLSTPFCVSLVYVGFTKSGTQRMFFSRMGHIYNYKKLNFPNSKTWVGRYIDNWFSTPSQPRRSYQGVGDISPAQSWNWA